MTVAASDLIYSAQTERALVDRARGGDEEAWTALYQQHYDAIFRYLRARIREPSSVDDLAADVFVAAVRSIGRYRAERPFLAWLFGIARNIAHDHIRRQSRASRIFDRFRRDSDDEGQPFEVPSPELLEQEVVDRVDLASAIEQLTEPQREVLMLRYFSALSTAEIAAVMGRDPAAIYSLHARALIALREVLEKGPKAPAKFDLLGRQRGRRSR